MFSTNLLGDQQAQVTVMYRTQSAELQDRVETSIMTGGAVVLCGVACQVEAWLLW